ncbi:Uu.00g089350.m01.CDS01 [Anthostomella pinea]|uniref:Uu.00g089350.m01.CDS01 n=1 Tax=Anthostomella pinea TaxID=933095 RepID=A0AAI8VMN8_9PEZI|nr:Uu.00g089350.m01.CDS01 [Anthostomella pinea]
MSSTSTTTPEPEPEPKDLAYLHGWTGQKEGPPAEPSSYNNNFRGILVARSHQIRPARCRFAGTALSQSCDNGGSSIIVPTDEPALAYALIPV